MNALEFLSTKIIPDYLNQLETTLTAVYNGTSSHTLLTKKTAEMALLLLDKMHKEAGTKHPFYGVPNIEYGDERYNRLSELLPENEWDNEEAFRLLVYFFGEEKAVYVRHAWKKFPGLTYQEKWDRRSFRSPGKRELYFPRQLSFLGTALLQVYRIEYSGLDNKVFCYDLDIREQIIFDHQLPTDALYHLWAAAIDLDNSEVFSVFENIIFNKEPIGKVSSGVIRALLLSQREPAWQLVEKLLLAAQRQEGLRQTILEALDETSRGALIYMIKVLLDNKMTRFSAVVRALDVWAGTHWESEKESAVNAFLQKAYEYLSNPSRIPEGIQSKNNADIYMALWAQSVYDVEKTLPFLQQLAEDPSPEKYCVALKFVLEARHFELDMPIAYPAIDSKELVVIGVAATILEQRISVNPAHYDKHYPDLFDKLHAVLLRSPVKEKEFMRTVFSWMKIRYTRAEIFRVMLLLVLDKQERLDVLLSYFEEMDANVKLQLANAILPDHSGYAWQEKKAVKPITDFQRNFCFRILKERGELLSGIAFEALEKVTLTSEESGIFRELLKRKSGTTRSKVIAILLKQSDALLTDMVKDLLQGDAEQRLAGLDIALQLQQQQRKLAILQELVAAFRSRKSISQKEEILLSQLSDSDETTSFTVENGYGLFDPKQLSPVVAPVVDANDVYGKYLTEGAYGFSLPPETMKAAFQQLLVLLQQYKDYEYEVVNYDNTKATILLGNDFRQKRAPGHKYASPREEYEDYPWAAVWEQWYQSAGLQPRDLFLLNSIARWHDEIEIDDDDKLSPLVLPYIPDFKELIPEALREFSPYRWSNPYPRILLALTLIHPCEEDGEMLVGIITRMFAALPEELLYKEGEDDEDTYRYGWSGGWQANDLLTDFVRRMDPFTMPEHVVERCWNLYHWRQFTGLPKNIPYNHPPLAIFCRAFKQGIISESEMYRGLLVPDHIRMLSTTRKYKGDRDYFETFPFLTPMFARLREHILDIELKRGDSPTAVSKFVAEVQRLEGIHRFASILMGLGKTTLYKGYYYSSGDASKQQAFSALLKRCYPCATDTQKAFEESIRSVKVPEERLLEAAVYAPQWQKYVSGFLGWKGLDSAIWWMHAHTKSYSFGEVSAEAESEIARYSAVDIDEFKEGAVDKEWFQKAYKELGQERWQKVYDAAKYISDGNGHRRARLYADVMTGDLKIKEVTQKVKEKRDQDYLRLYGLIPLSKTNAEKDLLSRYEYIQQFKKESKQFSAQKQSSEAVAIRIAMENLARNAGYADPQRLTWAMETKQVQQILAKETQVQYDDVLIGLVITENGEADVVAFRNDKMLASVPAKYKKDKKILELNEFKKTLREQLRRSRKALEDAMVRGDGFQLEEMVHLFEHPVISKHLEKLVFTCKKGHGFYRNGALVSAKGVLTQPDTDDMIKIAHCTDLNDSREWSDYQRYCFEKQVQQPFKQVFRELYVPLAEELQEQSLSRRYAGHQVQPRQTVALLKTRGWKVDYEEGLQKVFHREGFKAKMYAQANWFSPAEVESPVLEQVIFHDLKSYRNVAFKDITPRIFSEVMRDIDLVVSVAHVGGVDPEASHSSIEMRTALLRETARLFKLNNVTVNGTHAKIVGQYGEYSVHLGSAVVHQMPGTYLSILPVHSQQRGRLFLPFADDDPKSAELISKVLLLARDKDIQDPTILQQLRF
ncbi:DUF4132 domain-containing protein [Chitinophaga filiformis]|uniref:DUF4132 domain-containing protein n=1 Tax=Chitinophaga filiformis TaxID=104663 RepID=UPI001F1AD92E|nr:DUF4132 domain-containing protein [Chitinophaga filiformis]MCF6405265.1 DUF4132 domain-containing protein [Chitinophaga filiformis]